MRARFTPKRGIGPACEQAWANNRRDRIAAIRRRYWDRLASVGHQRLDNALWHEARAARCLRFGGSCET
jgi:hypothetical protein